MAVVAQFSLPKRFAFAPLIAAACHFQNVIFTGKYYCMSKIVVFFEKSGIDLPDPVIF